MNESKNKYLLKTRTNFSHERLESPEPSKLDECHALVDCQEAERFGKRQTQGIAPIELWLLKFGDRAV